MAVSQPTLSVRLSTRSRRRDSSHRSSWRRQPLPRSSQRCDAVQAEPPLPTTNTVFPLLPGGVQQLRQVTDLRRIDPGKFALQALEVGWIIERDTEHFNSSWA